jgi:hypothetical protein
MPVYPSRRSGSAPQWLYDNTLKNATSAKLLEGGSGFADAYGGVPFPVPKDGVEVLWNHITRYRGIYVVRRASEAPVQRNGSFAWSPHSRKRCSTFTVRAGSTPT